MTAAGTSAGQNFKDLRDEMKKSQGNIEQKPGAPSPRAAINLVAPAKQSFKCSM